MMEKSYLDKRKADIEYHLDVINEKIAERFFENWTKAFFETDKGFFDNGAMRFYEYNNLLVICHIHIS